MHYPLAAAAACLLLTTLGPHPSLAPNAAAMGDPAAPASNASTHPESPAPFSPAASGFRFRNSFHGSPLPAALRGGNSGVQKWLRQNLAAAGVDENMNYGLCGGMSLAAADFFHAGLTPPNLDTPPAQDSPLYTYLYQRQTDSLGALGFMALKFRQWMDLPDAPLADAPADPKSPPGQSLQELTAIELAGILPRLDAGQLVPIGLVYQGPGGTLWENHQVLAYAYEDLGAIGFDLNIYDPNFPSDNTAIIRVRALGIPANTNLAASPRKQTDPAARALPTPMPTRVSCERVAAAKNPAARIMRVRGLFAMPYTPATPPPAAYADNCGIGPAPSSPPQPRE